MRIIERRRSQPIDPAIWRRFQVSQATSFGVACAASRRSPRALFMISGITLVLRYPDPAVGLVAVNGLAAVILLALLTTVRQPLVQMAIAGARLALGLARGERPAQTRVELATELIIRESTAPPVH